MDPHQPRLPLPHAGAPRTYRPPRAVNYHEDDEESEEYWNATASEDEQQPKSGTVPIRRSNTTNNVNTVSSRPPPPPRRRVTQHHHRDDPLTLSYNNEDHPGPSGPSGRERAPRPGGDVYHLPSPYVNPFAPLNRPHQPKHTPRDGGHEQYPPMHHSPPQGYPTSSPFGGPPPFYQPPSDSYFPGHGGIAPPHHGGSYYPHQPTNLYPGHPGFSSPIPYPTPAPIIHPYDDIHRAHVADPEVEKLRRQVRKLEMRDRVREEQQREEDAARRRQDAAEKAERRERRKMKEQEKLRQAEYQSRREMEARRDMEAKIFSKGQPMEQEAHVDFSEKKVEKMVNAASDYIAAARPNRGKNGGLEDGGIDDTGDILVAIKEFVEERLQRQERLGFEERSMKSAKSGKSTATARRGNKLEIVPYEQEVDRVTRNQIETIVLDVLHRLREPVQDAASAWDRSTFISTRPLSLRSPSRGYEARNGEFEGQPETEHHDSYGKRQLDPRTPDSQGQFSDRTAVEVGNQYRPLEIDPDTIRLRKPPPKNDGERKRQSNTPALRVRTPAPTNDYFPEIHDQSAEEEYRPAKQPSKSNAAIGNDMLKKRPEKEQKRRKPKKVLIYDTDESDDLYPRRREGQYAGKPPRGSRRDHVAPPPTVPDAPPQGDLNPDSGLHRATVVTDAEEYD